jgi:hypothetical protein
MNAIPYDGPEEEWDSYEDEQEVALPGRPRRKVLTWWSAGLFAVLLGLVGFYVGVRVEKHQLANSSSTSGFAAALAGAGATGTGATGTGAARTGTGAAARTGATGSGAAARGAGGGAGGFRGLFGGGAAGSASVGTVSSISGNSLYITETSGNMVKVTLSSATKVTKSVGVGKNAVRPGDLVTVAGAKGSNGTVSATTVNDTGASPFGSSSSTSGSSSSGNTASSAVGSLFGGG